MKGHIYRRVRPDGAKSNWYAVIDLPRGAGGERQQRTSTHSTRRQAQAWLASMSQSTETGGDQDVHLTVNDYLEQWLEGKQSLRPSTRLSYQSHISHYLSPGIGAIRLVDLRAHHIEAMYGDIQDGVTGDRELSAATIRRIHSTLMSALGTAVRRGLLERNPAQTVELPAVNRQRRRLWTVQQLSGFLRAIHDDRLHALYVLLAYRGLRRGEAVGLTWSDVDLDRGELHICQQVVAVGGQLVVGPPKSEAGVRTVVLDRGTTDLLRAHRARQNMDRLKAGPRWVNSGLLFTGPTGKGINPAYVTRHFTVLVAQLGLPAIRLHDLRHLSATLGLASGESMKEVSDRLGHSSMRITADIYTQVPTEVARGSAQRLADHLTVQSSARATASDRSSDARTL